MNLEITQNLPTSPGYYWHRIVVNSIEHNWRIIRVVESKNYLFVDTGNDFVGFEEYFKPVDNFHYEFVGPIMEPIPQFKEFVPQRVAYGYGPEGGPGELT